MESSWLNQMNRGIKRNLRTGLYSIIPIVDSTMTRIIGILNSNLRDGGMRTCADCRGNVKRGQLRGSKDSSTRKVTRESPTWVIHLNYLFQSQTAIRTRLQ